MVTDQHHSAVPIPLLNAIQLLTEYKLIDVFLFHVPESDLKEISTSDFFQVVYAVLSYKPNPGRREAPSNPCERLRRSHSPAKSSEYSDLSAAEAVY